MTFDNEWEGNIIIYLFIENICYDSKDIDFNHKSDFDWNCDQHNVNITMKNDQKSHGWQFTAELNHPFSRKFSRTEALTHQSVLWDALHVYDDYYDKYAAHCLRW